MTGKLAQDQMCFSQNTETCASIRMLAVDAANELQKDQFSGIIGLAPPNPDEKNNIPAFINQIN